MTHAKLSYQIRKSRIFTLSRKGASIVEYGLILGLFSIAMIAGVAPMMSTLENMMTSAETRMMDAPDASSTGPVLEGVPGSFTSAFTEAEAGTTVTSDAVTMSGIDNPVAVAIEGAGDPAYSIDGSAFTSASGQIANGQSLRVRMTAPAAGTTRTAVIAVGGASARIALAGTASSAGVEEPVQEGGFRFVTTGGSLETLPAAQNGGGIVARIAYEAPRGSKVKLADKKPDGFRKSKLELKLEDDAIEVECKKIRDCTGTYTFTVTLEDKKAKQEVSRVYTITLPGEEGPQRLTQSQRRTR